jgi:large subunit ribosomal protein L25
MKEIVFQVEPREISNKHSLKALRSTGRIAGVFYGKGEKPVALSFGEKDFEKLLQSSGSSNILLKLKIKDEMKTAILKEIQRDIISHKPIHVDFQAVSLKEKIEVKVPLHIIGTSPGVKLSGGVLEHILRELTVKCLPTEIPDSIDIDVSALEINQSVAVKDLKTAKEIEILSDPESIIVNIVQPTILEEVAAPAAEGVVAEVATEPEVISKGKKPEEGEEAETAEKGKAEKKAAPAAEQPKK